MQRSLIEPMVLSIQSHVALGKVGNRAATFALERLGVEVMAVNTVQFSNHTGYPSFGGDAFSADHLKRLFGALTQRQEWAKIHAILTGYMGNAENAQAVLEEALLKKPEGIPYVCDPVLGDVGRGIFVPESLVRYTRECLVPQATCITPNHFEFELLVEQKVRTLEQAQSLCRHHPLLKGKSVILKSFLYEGIAEERIATYIYDASTQEDACFETERIRFTIPPNGIGDLFAALFLGYSLRGCSALKACDHAVQAVHKVLNDTQANGARELRIIQNQHELDSPFQGWQPWTHSPNDV